MQSRCALSKWCKRMEPSSVSQILSKIIRPQCTHGKLTIDFKGQQTILFTEVVTLLGKSRMRGQAVLHTMFESQREQVLEIDRRELTNRVCVDHVWKALPGGAIQSTSSP
jgi:hypothetical protein